MKFLLGKVDPSFYYIARDRTNACLLKQEFVE
jgi:hypothetical protein